MDLRAHLDSLDTALAAATPGRWRRGALAYIYTDSPGSPVVADEVGATDAMLIVAAVNALPGLLAATRAAADLADQMEAEALQSNESARHHRAAGWQFAAEHADDLADDRRRRAADLRTALAAALTEGDQP